MLASRNNPGIRNPPAEPAITRSGLYPDAVLDALVEALDDPAVSQGGVM